MPKAIDLTGLRFGMISVLRKLPDKRHRQSVYVVQCDCGVTKEVLNSNVISSKSCGCSRIEFLRKSSTTHGKSKTLEGKLYAGAFRRATNQGIDFNIDRDDIVIPEFCPLLGIPLKKEEEYIGKCAPSKNSPSLDRIDPSKGYVKGNIWVVSHRANAIKNDASIEELLMIC